MCSMDQPNLFPVIIPLPYLDNIGQIPFWNAKLWHSLDHIRRAIEPSFRSASKKKGASHTIWELSTCTVVPIGFHGAKAHFVLWMCACCFQAFGKYNKGSLWFLWFHSIVSAAIPWSVGDTNRPGTFGRALGGSLCCDWMICETIMIVPRRSWWTGTRG